MRKMQIGAGPVRIAAFAYLAGVAAFVAWVCVASIRDHYTIPFWDDWRILNDFFSTPFLEWMYAGGNGHRMPATFALLWLDYEHFGGRMHLLTIASLLSLLACIPVSWAAARTCRECAPSTRAIGFGFTVFVVFLAGRGFNLHWGINQGSSLTTLWFLIALACGIRHAAAERPSPRLLWIASVAALLATFGHGIGFATWISLGSIFAIARVPLRDGLLLALAAAVSIGVYSAGLTGTPLLSSLRRVFEDGGHLLQVLEYSAVFIGTPLARVAQGLGWVDPSAVQKTGLWVGGPAILAAGLYGARRLYAGGARPSELLAVGFMVFPLVGSFIIGVTRQPTHMVAWRYVCWSGLFWIGGAWALLGSAGRAPRSLWPVLVFPLLSLAAPAALRPAHAMHEHRGGALSRLELALLMEVDLEPFRAKVSPLPVEILMQVAERLRHDGRSVFDDPRSGAIGQPVHEHFDEADSRRCEGVFGLGKRVAGSQLWSVYGTAWDTLREAPVESVLIVNARGMVQGLGNLRKRLRPHPDPSLADREWFGYVPIGRCRKCTAYGLLDDGRVCELSDGKQRT